MQCEHGKKNPHASHMLWGPEIIHVNPFVSVFVGPGSSSHIDIFCELGKKAKNYLGNLVIVCVCVMSHFIGVFVPKKYVGSGVNVESVKVTTD